MMVMVLGTAHCSMSQTSPSSATPTATNQAKARVVQLSGVLTRRGAQIDMWWGMRATEDGKLWRLEPTSPSLKEQFSNWNNQHIHVQGAVLDESQGGSQGAAQGGIPTLQVTDAHLVMSKGS